MPPLGKLRITRLESKLAENQRDYTRYLVDREVTRLQNDLRGTQNQKTRNKSSLARMDRKQAGIKVVK